MNSTGPVRWFLWLNLAWAAAGLAMTVFLALLPGGHPTAIIFVPLVLVIWLLGHGALWMVRWLARRGVASPETRVCRDLPRHPCCRWWQGVCGLASGRPASTSDGLLAGPLLATGITITFYLLLSVRVKEFLGIGASRAGGHPK